MPGENHADVLIAGGGIAGASLAIHLGRAGLRVELFECAQFPREKPCGEGLMPAGVAALERLGLREATGGAPFRGIRYHSNGHVAEGPFPAVPGWPANGLGQRRLHLDRVLFEAAAATPGVTAHTGAVVEAPLVDGGRVAGLRINGASRRAGLVVAADGVHSRLRHAMGLDVPAGRKRFGARAHFRAAAGQDEPLWVDVFVCRGYELYVAPLPGREWLVAALVEAEALDGSIERAFHRWWRSQPALARRLEGAEQTSSLLCTSPLAGRARAGFAPGIVLLGDAAGFSDPITGGGMTQALQTSELLAGYLSTNGCRSDAWLAPFDRERRAVLRDSWRLTQMVLWLAKHPAAAQLAVAGLRRMPGLLSHFVGVAGGVRSLFPSFRFTRGGSRAASSGRGA